MICKALFQRNLCDIKKFFCFFYRKRLKNGTNAPVDSEIQDVVIFGGQSVRVDVRIVRELQHARNDQALAVGEVDDRHSAVSDVKMGGENGVWNVEQTAEKGSG